MVSDVSSSTVSTLLDYVGNCVYQPLQVFTCGNVVSLEGQIASMFHDTMVSLGSCGCPEKSLLVLLFVRRMLPDPENAPRE